MRFDLVDSDARALDETLNRQFFGPITLLNFGPDVAAPVYRTLVEEPVDLQRLATSVSTLVSVGLRVPAKWARKKFGIPAPADGEEVLAAAATDADEWRVRRGRPATERRVSDHGKRARCTRLRTTRASQDLAMMPQGRPATCRPKAGTRWTCKAGGKAIRPARTG